MPVTLWSSNVVW